MPLNEIETLLKRTMGLDAASIGLSSIERAIRQRQEIRRLDDVQEYWKCLQASEEELQELIEAVVVPETWFFRDKEAFAALGRVVNEEWLPTHPEGAVRLLSVPCSTGEEPYTMAMALLDAGMPAERIQIDAMDISARVIQIARHGVYRRNSFRGANLGFRERYFEPVDHGHRLRENVRSRVTFRQGNLLEQDGLAGQGMYDVIFCRNVLIYFDRPTQDRVIRLLTAQLAPRGFLFVGAAETGILLNHDFVSAKIPLAFAFRKEAPPPAKQSPANRLHREDRERKILKHSLRPAGAGARLPSVKAHAPKPSAPRMPEPRPKPESPGAISLDAAMKLADGGCLAEAAALCEAHLKEKGPSVEAFSLLGLIEDAAGKIDQACQYYRKALYLKPNHYEALVHLAYLMEKLGDAAGAQALHNRARRAKEKEAK